MKRATKIRLEGKGWTTKDILHAEEAMDKASSHDVHFSKIVFWTALIVTIFANVGVSLLLIPFLVAFNKLMLFSIIILLAGSIGFLYSYIVTDIGHLEKKHHILAGILLPIIALVNVAGMVLISNRLIVDLKVQQNVHNPWIIGIVFGAAFIFPYFLMRIIHHTSEKKKVSIQHS